MALFLSVDAEASLAFQMRGGGVAWAQRGRGGGPAFHGPSTHFQHPLLTFPHSLEAWAARAHTHAHTTHIHTHTLHTHSHTHAHAHTRTHTPCTHIHTHTDGGSAKVFTFILSTDLTIKCVPCITPPPPQRIKPKQQRHRPLGCIIAVHSLRART